MFVFFLVITELHYENRLIVIHSNILLYEHTNAQVSSIVFWKEIFIQEGASVSWNV